MLNKGIIFSQQFEAGSRIVGVHFDDSRIASWTLMCVRFVGVHFQWFKNCKLDTCLRIVNIGSNLRVMIEICRCNDLMESKGGKKKSSSSRSFYEAPLGYTVEDVRPNGGIKKFRSAAYSNCARKPS